MAESIVIALVKTLASFLFNQYLQTTVEVKVDGAPYWYYQEDSDNICAFGYRNGDYSQIENLKLDIENRLHKQLKIFHNKAIYENFGKISKPDEKQIVDKFQKDDRLKQFVHFNIKYKKIEYRDEVNRVFGKGCIEKKLFFSYSKNRLREIKKEVSLHREHNAFDELEKGVSNGANSYFKELDEEF